MWEKEPDALLEMLMAQPLESAVSTQAEHTFDLDLPPEMHTTLPPKGVKNVHNSQKLESTQMSINSRMDKTTQTTLRNTVKGKSQAHRARPGNSVL